MYENYTHEIFSVYVMSCEYFFLHCLFCLKILLLKMIHERILDAKYSKTMAYLFIYM